MSTTADRDRVCILWSSENIRHPPFINRRQWTEIGCAVVIRKCPSLSFHQTTVDRDRVCCGHQETSSSLLSSDDSRPRQRQGVLWSSGNCRLPPFIRGQPTETGCVVVIMKRPSFSFHQKTVDRDRDRVCRGHQETTASLLSSDDSRPRQGVLWSSGNGRLSPFIRRL